MRVSSRQFAAITIATLALAAGLSGCGPAGPVWVDEGKSYTNRSVTTVMDVADTSKLTDRPTSDAPALRHSALSALRKDGESAARVADLLTSTFEPDTRGVPVYVEQASVDGTVAVIVVEATGPKSGKLDSKRLWVLDRNGDVIMARSR